MTHCVECLQTRLLLLLLLHTIKHLAAGHIPVRDKSGERAGHAVHGKFMKETCAGETLRLRVCNQLDKFVDTYDNPAVDFSALVPPENPKPDPPVSPEASPHEQWWCFPLLIGCVLPGRHVPVAAVTAGA